MSCGQLAKADANRVDVCLRRRSNNLLGAAIEAAQTTSIPAPRAGRATTFTPRSWPSGPTFVNNTRIGCGSMMVMPSSSRSGLACYGLTLPAA